MSRPRVPGQPSPRALAAKELYLQMGPGRSLGRLLDMLKRREEIAGRPSTCTRLATLETWCARYNWVQEAILYDQQQARQRARALAEQERQAAAEDTKTLLAALRGCTALATVILSRYVDERGQLVKEADLKDASSLLRVALSGRRWVDAAAEADEVEEQEATSTYEVEQVLQAGSPEQRQSVLLALRQLQVALQDADRTGQDSAQRTPR